MKILGGEDQDEGDEGTKVGGGRKDVPPMVDRQVCEEPWSGGRLATV